MQVTPTEVLAAVVPHLGSPAAEVADAAVRAVESVASAPMIPSVRQDMHARLLACLTEPGRPMHAPLARARLARAAIETAGLTTVNLSPQTAATLQVRVLRWHAAAGLSPHCYIGVAPSGQVTHDHSVYLCLSACQLLRQRALQKLDTRLTCAH